MHYGDSTLCEPDTVPHSKREENMPVMASRHDIESARLSMLKARKALEVYEAIMGFAWSCEQTRLNQGFTDAIGTYLTDIIHDFGDTEILLWYKHVEMTMF
jgi:hypothetical protein